MKTKASQRISLLLAIILLLSTSVSYASASDDTVTEQLQAYDEAVVSDSAFTADSSSVLQNLEAYSTTKTQAEAVAWAQAQIGQSLDYDGAYGAQCVDLIAYYYNFLGEAVPGGNGCDYATNALPSGWSRIPYYSGFVAQPGDVAVWTYGSTSSGHVAVVVSADSTSMTVIDQRGQTGTAANYSTYKYTSMTFYGVNRPDFNKDTEAPSILTVKVDSLNDSAYSLTSTFSDNIGVTRVSYPTWTANNGQDDIIWHEAPISGNSATLTISASDHNNEGGWYITHVYAFDAAGNSAVYEMRINLTEMKIACSVDNGYLYYNTAGNIVGVDSSVTTLNIPTRVHGVENVLTSIQAGAFEGNTTLQEVTIPKRIASVGDNSFKNCTALKKVQLSDDTRFISESTFEGCTALESINFPSALISIGKKAFYGCTSLKSVSLSDTICVYESAFQGCTSLTEVIIPDDINKNESSGVRLVFADCTGLKNVTVPNAITSVSLLLGRLPYCFSSCDNIETVTLSNDVSEIEENIYIPYVARGREFNVFKSASLKNIYVNSENTSYRSNSGVLYTYDGSEITHYPVGRTDTSYSILSGTESIFANAFDYAKNLTEINIPASVDTIKDNFYGCTSLKAFNVADNNSTYTSVDGIIYSKDKKTLIKAPNAIEGDIVIEDGVETIANYAFYNCTNVKSITIPASVTEITSWTSLNCSAETVYVYKGSAADNASLYKKSTTIVYLSEPTASYIVGDANADGIITSSDAAYVLQKVLSNSFTLPCEEAVADYMTVADVNNDGMLTSRDSAAILQKTLDNSYQFSRA